MYKIKSSQNYILGENAALDFDSDQAILYLQGVWDWSKIEEESIESYIANIPHHKVITIDGSKLELLDTCGVVFIHHILDKFKARKIAFTIQNLQPSDLAFFNNISEVLAKKQRVPAKEKAPNLVSALGMVSLDLYKEVLDFATFLGGFLINFFIFLKRPSSLDMAEVSRTIQNCAVNGIWVAALLSFLIGITLAYEISPQFVTYGANVYIVNFLGISLLKEVSPLLTAVIVAGRTGASITAEMGTMKIQEEIDAIQTMGISPIQRLVLPKVIGILIAMPLVTAICDMVGMLGGAIVANSTLNVSYGLFLSRLQNYVSIHNYTDGLIKSIAFGFIIAIIGAKQGLSVEGNANSVGEQTTKSVVVAIILIVIVDAVFATIFKALGI